MSDTGASISSNRPPSPPRECREKNGHQACFYPGFVSRLAVHDADGVETTVLYEQTSPFILPPGYDKPWPTSTLEYTSPEGGRMILQIDDTSGQIDRIEVRLKPRPGAGGGGGERLVLENGPVLCPPICPE